MGVTIADKIRGMTVTVDRSKWNAKRMTGFRDEVSRHSGLYIEGPDDHCCFGFVAKGLGYQACDMGEHGYLTDLMLEVGTEPEVEINELNVDEDVREAIAHLTAMRSETPEYWITIVQDHERVPLDIKERAIKSMFKQFYDVTIEFVGEHPDV